MVKNIEIVLDYESALWTIEDYKWIYKKSILTQLTLMVPPILVFF